MSGAGEMDDTTETYPLVDLRENELNLVVFPAVNSNIIPAHLCDMHDYNPTPYYPKACLDRGENKSVQSRPFWAVVKYRVHERFVNMRRSPIHKICLVGMVELEDHGHAHERDGGANARLQPTFFDIIQAFRRQEQ